MKLFRAEMIKLGEKFFSPDQSWAHYCPPFLSRASFAPPIFARAGFAHPPLWDAWSTEFRQARSDMATFDDAGQEATQEYKLTVFLIDGALHT